MLSRTMFLTILTLCGACAGDFMVDLNSTDASESSSSDPSSGDSTISTDVTTASTQTSADSSSSSEAEGSSESSDASSSGTPADTTSTETGCEALGECVPCQEATPTACAEESPATPVCGPDGFCVQCSEGDSNECSGNTPVCQDNACAGCSRHDQCPGSACDVETGACFDPANVNEVDGDGGADFETISEALADGYVVLVHEQTGSTPYTESVAISGLTVAILAAPGENPILQGIGGTPTVDVSDSSIVYLQALDIRGNTDDVGVQAVDSTLYVDQSFLVQNNGGGVSLVGSVGHLQNTIVGGNGGNFSPTSGISSTDSTLDLLYTTVALNEGDGAESIQCTSTSGDIRNSIVVGSDPASFNCPGVTSSYSAFDEVVGGTANEDVSPLVATWFVNPANNYHLTASGESVFGAVALWSAGDPASDIDGTDPRPAEDDSGDVAGADVP